ncbi:MAG: SnoaL-like domain-containing protein [Acidimicrobiales bacterium]|nr:SnoaL-like domain-containing protein [Acidimicrobiales bacterium]
MAEPEQIRSTVEKYLALFTAKDRDGWLALWSDDATMEDPVGSDPRRGKEEIGAFFDQGHTQADSVELRPDGPVIVLGHEASFTFQVRPTLGGQAFVLPAIDVMTFDEAGLITSQRAFVDFGMLAPAED